MATSEKTYYTSSYYPIGTYGRVWGAVTLSQSDTPATYSRITISWLGECWDSSTSSLSTYSMSNSASISITINGTKHSGTITGSRSHEVSSSHVEWTASNASSSYVDIAKKTSAQSITLSLSYTVAGTTYTGSISTTVPALAKYTVKYAVNSGTGAPASQTKYYGKTLTLSSTKPTKTGYTFSKWKASDNTLYSAGGSYTKNEATTLTAQWTAKKYTLTYNANEGTCSTASKSVTYNSAYGTLATPTRTGYSFDDWYTTKIKTDGSRVTSSTTCTGDATIFAQWDNNTYSVKYNGNGNTSGSMSNSSHTYDIAKALTANVFKKTGYAFQGWATSATGSVKYTDKQSVKNLTSTQGATINLYAVWSSTYTAPKISDLLAVRCDQGGNETLSGEYVKLSFNWTAGLTPSSNPTYGSSIEVVVQTLNDTSEPITYTTTSTDSSGHVELGPLDLAVGKTGTATITISDTSITDGEEVSKTIELPKGGFPVHISKNEKAIRFFGVCDDKDDDGVYIDGKLEVKGDLTIEGHDSPVGTVINSRASSATVVPSGTSTAVCSIKLPAGVWVIRAFLRIPTMGTDRTKYVEANISSTKGATGYYWRAPCENLITETIITQIGAPTEPTIFYLNVIQNSGSNRTFVTGSSTAQNIRAVRIA